jgi:hypothetical protein
MKERYDGLETRGTTFLCGFCQHLIASIKNNITVFRTLQP